MLLGGGGAFKSGGGPRWRSELTGSRSFKVILGRQSCLFTSQLPCGLLPSCSPPQGYAAPARSNKLKWPWTETACQYKLLIFLSWFSQVVSIRDKKANRSLSRLMMRNFFPSHSQSLMAFSEAQRPLNFDYAPISFLILSLTVYVTSKKLCLIQSRKDLLLYFYPEFYSSLTFMCMILFGCLFELNYDTWC